MGAFDEAFKFTIGNEGGYSNHPSDKGGPTNFGITQADLSRWLKHPASIQEVKNMTLATAKAIYKARYWDAMGLDYLTSGAIAMCMFDIGVVMGIGIPPKWAQQICNAHHESFDGAPLVEDGHLGPLSQKALNAVDPRAFIRDFSAKAEARFRGIAAAKPSQKVFLKGWLNRAARLLTLIPK